MGGTQVCDECYEPLYYHDKLCWTECPEHTFSYEGQNDCYGIIYIYIYINTDCHPTCKKCTEASESSCTKCHPSRTFTPLLNRCLTEPPQGFYLHRAPPPPPNLHKLRPLLPPVHLNGKLLTLQLGLLPCETPIHMCS